MLLASVFFFWEGRVLQQSVQQYRRSSDIGVLAGSEKVVSGSRGVGCREELKNVNTFSAETAAVHTFRTGVSHLDNDESENSVVLYGCI